MKDYTKSEELVNDLREFLTKRPLNSFTKITYNLLENPKLLIKEYRANPDLRLVNGSDWLFVWRNCHAKIGEEYVTYDDLFTRLETLLKNNR